MPPNEDRYIVVREFMTRGLGLAGLPLLVYARIYGFCRSGGTCFESKKSMSDLLCVDERSIYRAIKTLKELGLITEVGTHSTPGGHETKEYAVSWDAISMARLESRNPDETPSPDNLSGDIPSFKTAAKPDRMPPHGMAGCHPISKRENKNY